MRTVRNLLQMVVNKKTNNNRSTKMKKLVKSAMIASLAIVSFACGGCKDDRKNDRQLHGADIRARVSDMANKGRELYVAIVMANTEREALGFQSVWPVTAAYRSNDKSDISGMVFRTSAEYFKVLFGLPEAKDPYVAKESNLALSEGGKQPLWSVMLDLNDKISDHVPVIVSSNFDCSRLPAKWPVADHEMDMVIKIGDSPVIGNTGIVFIRKSGQAVALPADKVTLRNIYSTTERLTLPAKYLTPNGVVKAK